MFAQDEGGEGLVGYADVQVNLKDINDNAPLFRQGIYFGNVTENGTAGKQTQPNLNLVASREKVVSFESQTLTNEAKITVLFRT